jgi:hypothetical protein
MTGPRYSIIHGDAATDPRLKGKALQVLCILGRHTDRGGWCSRSQVKMAEKLQCARSTIQAAIAILVECGYVQQKERFHANNGKRSHEYRVLLDDRKPSEFINDFDELDDDGVEFDDTHADIPASPMPAQNRHGDAGPEPASNRTIPSKNELEREARGARRDGVVKETPSERAARIASEAWADSRFISALWQPWPDTATEVISRTYPAWQRLTAAEQEAAIAAIPTAVAAMRAGRSKGSPRLFSFLEGKGWKNFHIPAAAGKLALSPVMLRPGSDLWWSEFWRRVAAGEPVRFMFDQAFPNDRRDPVGVGVQPFAMPSDESVAALVTIAVRDGDAATPEFSAWSDYMSERHGLRRFNHNDLRNPFIKVPSQWPPGSMRRASDDGTLGKASGH